MRRKCAHFCSIFNGFPDNGQFTFWRSCDLKGSCDLKIAIFKSYYFVGSKETGVENNLHFSLSLLVSKMKHVVPTDVTRICIHILPNFNRLGRNDIGVIPVKFPSIIPKHVAYIDVSIICLPTH